MKRLGVLVGIFILTSLIFGGFSAPQKTYAQLESVNADLEAGAPAGSGAGVVSAPPKAVSPDVARGGKQSKCSLSLSGFSLVDCVDAFFATFITTVSLTIAGWFLWLTATMMNYSIDVGILHFSDWAGASLYPIWILIRQIVSLFVVFAGLYLGFMYVLGKEDTFEKYIPWVIIFALFVNFSYPLVRTAVDISNVISLNIYTSAVGPGTLDKGVDPDTTAGALIRNKLGLSGLVDYATKSPNAQTGLRDALEASGSTPAALLAVIYIVYAAYIFFMVTFIITSRTAILVFLIVASPFLLVDTIIPKLGDVAAKMRKIFFEQLAVGPVFTIMLALTLKFMDIFRAGPLGGADLSSITGEGGAIKLFFNLLMMIIMLHIMLKVTRSLAGEFGNYVGNTMGKVGAFAVNAASTAAIGAATGGTGLLARASIGRAAAAVRDSDWVTNNQAGGAKGFLGRRMYDMSNSVAKSSFDVRNSSMIAGGAQKLGLNMGMGTKGGYEEKLNEKIEDRKTRYGRIKVTNDDGTVNQAGVEAKQKFFASQGTVAEKGIGRAFGIATDKAKIGKALLEEDRASAIKDNDSINRYNKLDEGKRQSYFKAEKDPALQKQFLAIDQATAEKENKERDQKIKDQREESEGKFAVYNASSPERRQTIYNNDLNKGEQSRVRATDEEEANESEGKFSVYNSNSVTKEKRRDVYNYDMNNKEKEIARGMDETEAMKEDVSRQPQPPVTPQSQPTTPTRPVASSDESYSRQPQPPVTPQSQAARPTRQVSQNDDVPATQSRPVVTPLSTTINDKSSTVVTGDTVSNTTTNTTNINGTQSPLPSGYTTNPRGRLAVPTSVADSMTSSFQSETKTGRSGGAGLLSVGTPGIDSKAVEQQAEAYMSQVSTMKEDQLESFYNTIPKAVADRVREKLKESKKEGASTSSQSNIPADSHDVTDMLGRY